MSRANSAADRAVIHTANVIKLRRPRRWPGPYGGVAFRTRLYNMRQLDQAVNLVRRRGTPKEKQVLVAAGFAPSRRR